MVRMNREELDRRLRDADRARLLIRRATAELRQLGATALARKTSSEARKHAHGTPDPGER